MLIFEIMLALLGAIGLVVAMCAIMFGIAVIIAKTAARSADKKELEQREKYPDYYAKLEEYNTKYGAAIKFETEHIDAKKKEIDELEKEIKYLPEIHTTKQKQQIEKLKEEIYENTWQLKTLILAYMDVNEEVKCLREKYGIH